MLLLAIACYCYVLKLICLAAFTLVMPPLCRKLTIFPAMPSGEDWKGADSGPDSTTARLVNWMIATCNFSSPMVKRFTSALQSEPLRAEFRAVSARKSLRSFQS